MKSARYLLICFLAFPALKAVEIHWFRHVGDFGGRVQLWTLPTGDIPVFQPRSLVPASKSTPNGPMPQLSLVHSGYTGSDPDGKSALLSGILYIPSVPLSQEEGAALKSAGIKLEEIREVTDPTGWTVDLEIPSNPAEAQRIRNLLGWPLAVGSGTFSFSIKWTALEGEQLYKLLIDIDDGLRIVVRARSSVNAEIKCTMEASEADLSNAWKRVAGNAEQVILRNDPGELVAQLLAGNLPLVDGMTVNPPLAFALNQEVYKKRIAKICIPRKDGLGFTVLRSDFLKLSLANSLVTRLESQVAVEIPFYPGNSLRKNAQLVVDLTSGSKDGIDAIRKSR